MLIIGEDDEILLRTWNKDDAKMFFELNNDAQVLKYTGDCAFVDENEALMFINNYKDFENFKCGRWFVQLKSVNRILGWCGIKYHMNGDYYDLGFRFFAAEWSKGYATKASIIALRYAKEHLSLNRITARAMQENTASIRVLQKLGFTQTTAIIENEISWLWFEKQL